MIAVYIVGGILLLLCTLLFVKISFRIVWCDGLFLKIKIGFISFEKQLGKGIPKEEAKYEVKSESPEKPKANEKKPPLKEVIRLVYDTVKAVYTKAKKHIKLEKYIVRINVATNDVAETGIVYGAVSSVAASLHTFVMNIKNADKNNVYTEVTPDFISEKPEIYIDIILATRVWRGLSVALTLTHGISKYKEMKKSKGDFEDVRHSSEAGN